MLQGQIDGNIYLTLVSFILFELNQPLGLNLMEIIESPLHYHKWSSQSGKTLDNFLTNLLVIAEEEDQPTEQ